MKNREPHIRKLPTKNVLSYMKDEINETIEGCERIFPRNENIRQENRNKLCLGKLSENTI